MLVRYSREIKSASVWVGKGFSCSSISLFVATDANVGLHLLERCGEAKGCSLEGSYGKEERGVRGFTESMWPM